MKVKVTIIIPAYNAQDSIADCLDSAVGQTFENIEIVVVNDGSGDGTRRICSAYEKKYPNIRVIDSENGGVSRARNLGLRAASGDWICFLDADDRLEKAAVEVMMKYAGSAQWVIGNYYMVDLKRGLEKTVHEQYFSDEIRYGTKEDLPELCVFRNFHCVWGKLYSAELIRKNRLQFETGRDYGEDLLFNMDYFQYVEEFVVLSKPLYEYRFQRGEGLGTRDLDNEWELQQFFCSRLQKMVREIYRLSPAAQGRMNHFYYAQFIASLERAVDEKQRWKRQTQIREIVRSPLFQRTVEKEYRAGRIKALDFFLLKAGLAVMYCNLHRGYVWLKNKKKRMA